MNKWKIGEIRDLSTSDSYKDGQQYYLARELSGSRKKKSSMGKKRWLIKSKNTLWTATISPFLLFVEDLRHARLSARHWALC